MLHPRYVVSKVNIFNFFPRSHIKCHGSASALPNCAQIHYAFSRKKWANRESRFVWLCLRMPSNCDVDVLAVVCTFQFPALRFTLDWMAYRTKSSKPFDLGTREYTKWQEKRAVKRKQSSSILKNVLCASENSHIRSVAYLWPALLLPGASRAARLPLALSLFGSLHSPSIHGELMCAKSEYKHAATRESRENPEKRIKINKIK